ncbi:MAG: DJ-1/PfpI family protein [Rhodopila sp.]
MGDPDRIYLDFLVKQSTGARYVASVCEGALLLAAAGLLDGYDATTHWAFIPCFTERFQKVNVVAAGERQVGQGWKSCVRRSRRVMTQQVVSQ